MNIFREIANSVKWIEEKFVHMFQALGKFKEFVQAKINPIKSGITAFVGFMVSVHIFFYQQLKNGFTTIINKIGDIKTLHDGVDGSMGDFSAIELLEKIEIANAIFPLDHLLNCAIFIFSAWVVAFEIKFVLFVIRLQKP